jgi:Domain of unknown function (DUF4365)
MIGSIKLKTNSAYCAYWLSLRRQPQSTNQTTVTVYLPRQNIFNVDTLRNLMQRIAMGEPV